MRSVVNRAFEAIGTKWFIEFSYDPSMVDPERVLQKVLDRIDAFDHAYSRFRSDSLVTKMAEAPGVYRLPQDAGPMLDLYRDLYEYTNGAFTPLIGSTLSAAGYDATYSLTEKEVFAPPAWDEALSWDAPNLVVRMPIMLDVGAAGKGYLVDLVAQVLREEGVTEYLIDAGGDIAVQNATTTATIGLEHPEDPSQVIGVAEIHNQSICGSSGSRRAWGRFHHIIDPRTLTSPQHIRAVWVVADSTMLADALATCLYLVPPAMLVPHYAFEYLIVKDDYTAERSQAFPAEVFTRDSKA